MSARAYRSAFRDAYETSRVFTLHVRVRRGEPSVMIIAYDSRRYSPTGHSYLDLEVRHEGRIIFDRGALSCGVPAGTSTDGNEARELALATVAMKPGDTDAEYFESYTPEQLDWARKYGEELGYEREARYCYRDGSGRIRRAR